MLCTWQLACQQQLSQPSFLHGFLFTPSTDSQHCRSPPDPGSFPVFTPTHDPVQAGDSLHIDSCFRAAHAGSHHTPPEARLPCHLPFFVIHLCHRDEAGCLQAAGSPFQERASGGVLPVQAAAGAACPSAGAAPGHSAAALGHPALRCVSVTVLDRAFWRAPPGRASRLMLLQASRVAPGAMLNPCRAEQCRAEQSRAMPLTAWASGAGTGLLEAGLCIQSSRRWSTLFTGIRSELCQAL